MNELYHYGVKGMRWGQITQDPYERNSRERKIDAVNRQYQRGSSANNSSSGTANSSPAVRQAQAHAKVSSSSSSGKSFMKSNSKMMNTPVSQLKAAKKPSLDSEHNGGSNRQTQQPNSELQRMQYEAERERAQYEAEQEAMINMMIKTRQAAGMPMTDEEIQRMRTEGVSMRVNQGNYGNMTYGNRRRG